MDFVVGLKGPNEGRIMSLEAFDINIRNILNSLAPLIGVDITEEDVENYKQILFNEGRFELKK